MWRIVGGPREFNATEQAHDIDVGWAYDIERGSERRTIRTAVAGGRLGSSELPDEARRAVRSSGRSAVEAVLADDDPPAMLMIGTGGVRPA